MPDTGAWLLQSEQYAKWKTTPASVCWLYGLAGTGKTILSSGVIQDIEAECSKDPAKSLAYFFFDFNDASKQDPDKMLRAVISQLLDKCIQTPEKLQAAYSTCRKAEQSASTEQLLEALGEISATLPTSYIILDALDECQSRENLLEILDNAANWGHPNLHMIFTSRREVEIEEGLEFVPRSDRVCLESRVVDNDICKYVYERLLHDRTLRRWQKDPEMQHKIEVTLTNKANGM